MAEEKTTRGQELYFRHLSLFSKAVPLTIKATIRKLIDQNGQSLNTVLTGKKEHIQTFYKALYQVLFADSSENIESQIHTWNIKTLCEIVFVLIDHPKIDCVKCILDQLIDLENYANSASIDYITFQHKWNALEKSLHTLCSDTDVKFECTRLIHSFDELKDINKDVYENLKSTKDVNKHIQIATENELLSNLNSQTGAESLKVKQEVKNTVYTENTSNIREIADNSKVKDLPNVGAENKETVEIVKHLSNQVVNAGESVALVCKLNTDGCQVSWSKNGEILTDTETVDILASKGSHFLIVQVATTEDSGTYTCTHKDLFTSASVIVSNQDLHIIKSLQVDDDGDVIKYMKVSFSCTCDIPQKTPRWFHNNKEIKGNDERVTAVSKEYEHKLIIHNVELSDKGEYMVVFDRVTSKTSITVKDLHISKPLHVNYDGDIREYMKISLSCTINIPRTTPKWFHNNTEIEENNERVTIVSTDCEYKLIIHHVEFADEGEYMVAFGKMTSKTSITVKGHIDLSIKHQIKEELYRNWIRGVLALKYLKLGLESPAEKEVIGHHKQILKALPKTVSKKACLECNSENLLPLHVKRQCPRIQNKHKCICSRNPHRRRLCPSNELCSEIYDLIVRDHRFEDPALKNTSMDKWRSDPWSIAARRHRNELLHNARFEISEDKLCEYLSDFRDVLEVKNNSNERCFTHFDVEKSLEALNDLKCYQIDIYTKDEIEQMKKDIRATAMQEETNKLEAALKQKDEDFRQFQEKLKDDSKTREMCVKHDGTFSTWYCSEHNKFFCKSCMEKEHRKCSGLLKRIERHNYDKPVSIVVKKSLKLESNLVTICALPNGEYLAQFAAMFRFEVCKLNETFQTIARCDLRRTVQASMCYVGNNKVALSLNDYQLKFIDVKNLHILEQKVTLIENVQHLTGHGDTIYAFNGGTVFSCTIAETVVRTLCVLPERKLVYFHMGTSMTVSDDGDFIYCTHQSGHVYKVDSSDGKVLLKLNLYRLQDPKKAIETNNSRASSLVNLVSPPNVSDVFDELNLGAAVDVCYIGNGTVIVCDNEGHIIQIESDGDYSVTTIDDMKRNSTFIFTSTIYDRSTSSLIAVDGDVIKIFRVT